MPQSQKMLRLTLVSKSVISAKGGIDLLDLKSVIEKYPRNVGTRSQLASLLRDLYPSEKRAVNAALAVYDSGITSRLASLKSIDTVMLHSFIKLLVDEFGIQEQFAVEGIEVWAKAYDISVSKDNYVHQPSEYTKPITHNPDAYAKPGILNGMASDYELEQHSHGWVITKFRGFEEADVIIPNQIDGKRIVGIGKAAYFNCKAMKTLLISDGIEFIEDSAFANCENLSKVTFPTTLSRIGSIERPNTYRSILDPMPQGAFENSGLTEILLPNGLKEICKHSFSGCKKLVSAVLPSKLGKIGGWAFNYCTSLNDIHFPMSLTEIGAFAFNGCLALTVVVLNEGLTKIGMGAFQECENLTKILIPSTVIEIVDDSSSRDDYWSLLRESKKPNLTVYCYSGSYGLQYAREKGYPVQNAVNFTN